MSVKAKDDYRCWHPVLLRPQPWGKYPNRAKWICTNCKLAIAMSGSKVRVQPEGK